MMKKLLILSLSGLLFAGGVTFAQAQVADPNGGHHDGGEILAKIHDQNVRIDEGRKRGELTHEEAESLHGKEQFLHEKLDDFKHKNGGFLTNNEQYSLFQSLDKLDDEIRRTKHEGR